MAKVIIKQTRSVIGRPKRQKDTMIALGLKKIGSTKEVEASDQILGMINKVKHLIEVKEL